MSEKFDVICLGAGPAGEALVAGLKGSGLSLAVAEKNLVGGECAYWGCIPSKTLLRSAETLAEADRARELAASRVEYSVDFAKIHKRAAWMSRDWDDSGAAKAIEDQGAHLFRGEARLAGPRTVEVDGTTLEARKAVVVATGTSPAAAPIPGLDGVEYWTNREAMESPDLPESLIIIGAGGVGVELAQAFSRFGSRVCLFENGARVIPLEEDEAGDYLQQRLVAEGIQVECGREVEKIQPEGAGVKVSLTGDRTYTAARLLVATGRKPNLDGFDLAAAGVATNQRGWIKVDPETLLAADGVYGAGDVNGIGGFTHLSHYHGTLVARAIKGEPAPANHSAIPRVTFTDPEVASVGLTEAQAKEVGIKVRVGNADVGNTARGYIHGQPGGLIKLVADADRQVLVGATLVGPRSGEMLSELALAIRAQVPLKLLDDLIHPFPTFSRVLQGVFAELNA